MVAGPRQERDMDPEQLEREARERLDPVAYDYFAGGAESETALAANLSSWGRWQLHPHVLRDVTEVDTSTTVLDQPIASPVLIAPTAYHAMAHPDGEPATARAAHRHGTVMVVSTLATTSLEDVAAVAPDAPRWFQLYVFADRGYAGELVDRAVAAGYRALVLTVDAPVLGHRPRDARNAFRLPDHLAMANLPADLPDQYADAEGSGLAAMFTDHDRSLTVDDLAWCKERSGLPLVVKGVHRADDAAACVEAGADAVVVSNHGGRQLDRAVPPAEVLGEVVAAVDGRAEVYVDGGVRRGVDVLTALALGARAVLVGRPVLWGLAVDGEQGVTAVLDGLRDELERAMTLAGVTHATAVPGDLVRRAT
jgi:4-hydroxymandelate oxidase